jgi:hypothetical protein
MHQNNLRLGTGCRDLSGPISWDYRLPDVAQAHMIDRSALHIEAARDAQTSDANV